MIIGYPRRNTTCVVEQHSFPLILPTSKGITDTMGGTSYPRGIKNGHAVFKCDHCGTQQLEFRPSKKKWALPKLLDSVRNWVSAQEKRHITAEEIAAHFRVNLGMVRHCLHLLNLEGLISQRSNHVPHDCRRDLHGYGSDNSWVASTYSLTKTDQNPGEG